MGGFTHPVALISLHETPIYAKSCKNECEQDRERQDALETMYSLGLHEEFLVKDEMIRRHPWGILVLYFMARQSPQPRMRRALIEFLNSLVGQLIHN
jgi:hypothetical protein